MVQDRHILLGSRGLRRAEDFFQNQQEGNFLRKSLNSDDSEWFLSPVGELYTISTSTGSGVTNRLVLFKTPRLQNNAVFTNVVFEVASGAGAENLTTLLYSASREDNYQILTEVPGSRMISPISSTGRKVVKLSNPCVILGNKDYFLGAHKSGTAFTLRSTGSVSPITATLNATVTAIPKVLNRDSLTKNYGVSPWLIFYVSDAYVECL